MNRSDGKETSFVADGHDRARRANEAAVRTAVEQAYTAELETASFWHRLIIRRRIKREIKRRLDRLAPPNALY